MKVCLIRPPKLALESSSPVVSFPPLGLAIIAAVLKENNIAVHVIDAACQKPNKKNTLPNNIYKSSKKLNRNLTTIGLSTKEIVNSIPKDVDIIGISCMFSSDWIYDRFLIKTIASAFKNSKLIAGGESITGMYKQILRQCPELNVCFLGESEDSIMEYVNAIKKNEPIEHIEGIAFQENGKIIKTPIKKRIREPDKLPFPAWEFFPLKNYPKPIEKENYNYITIPLLATRGCPYRCTFCTSPNMWGTKYIMRSPENVISEIEYIIEKFGIKCFDFFDLTAIINKRWILSFINLIKEKNIDIKWRFPAGTRSEAITAEVASELIENGCDVLIYAPETGSKRMLKIIKKRVQIKNMLQSMKSSKQKGLRVMINMIIGLPNEKHIDIFASCWFLIKCAKIGVNDVGLAKFRPYPGSELFNELEKENQINLSNDLYFIESLQLIDSIILTKVYNKNIPYKGVYIFYYFLMLASFYISQLIFHPKNFIHIFKYGSMYKYKTNLIQDIRQLLNFKSSNQKTL